MGSGKRISQETKTSRAIARCILTGTASVVATYLIWRVVDTFATELPFMFGSTCLLVGLIVLLSTGLAIYKISSHQAVTSSPASESTIKKSKKVESYSSDLIMAVSVDKSEGAWYQRN